MADTTEKISNFLQEVRQEMKKVTWLNRRELVRYTILVLSVSFVVAAILGGLDNLFRFILFGFVF